ncbi:hypothetical protein B296_00056223 [Ensete ventricosum]|uniref:Sulfotransferase n=1 Tax=Ensete ventricosum TaxID=4639 RepID=A0A426X1M5_ENSVE|nr:hypothetical protein B296_00056223 [Ensete ventricosum]
MVAQNYFRAHPTDVLIVTIPKSGTTWMKARVFYTINRGSDVGSRHALDSCNPHECIPFLELQIYTNNRVPELSKLPPPPATLLHTHPLPFPTGVGGGLRLQRRVTCAATPRTTSYPYRHHKNRHRTKANLVKTTACKSTSL